MTTSDEDSPIAWDDARSEADYVAELIQAFGGIRPMATKLGISFTTVQGWKQRGHIPPGRLDAIRVAAAEHGIEMIEPPQRPPEAIEIEGTAERIEAPVEPADYVAEPEPGAFEFKPQAEEVAAERAEPEYTAPPIPPEFKAEPVPPPQGVGFAGALGASSLVVAVALLIAYLSVDVWGPFVAAHLGSASEDTTISRVSELEGRVAGLEATLGDQSGAGDGEVAQLRSAVERQGGTVSNLTQRVDSLNATVEELSANIPMVDIQALSDMDGRINELAGKLEAAEGQLSGGVAADPAPAIEAAAAELSAEIAALDKRAADTSAAMAEQRDLMMSELGTLEEKLAALETAAEGAVNRSAGAAAVVLAVGQLRAALAESDPYAQELAAVTSLGAGSLPADALAKLEAHAASGVPTRAMLAARYEAVAGDITRAAVTPEGDDLLAQVTARVARLVTVRPSAGDVGGSGAMATVARASARLEKGDLEGAVAELDALEGEPAKAAAPWLEQAKARLAAEDALETLSAASIQALGASRQAAQAGSGGGQVQ